MKKREVHLTHKNKGANLSFWEKCFGKANRTYFLLLLCIALSAVTLLVYWQVGGYEFINFDDNVYVYDNLHVAEGLNSANIIWALTAVDAAALWHPVTWLSHMADVSFYGMNPGGHHLTSVFIHTVSSVLLLLLFFRLTGLLWQSAFVAVLFALHPLHVESVAWIAERKDVLSAFFGFLTIFLYASYVAKQNLKLYLLTIFSFVLALMAKPMLVTLPIVMLLLDFWPLNRDIMHAQKSGRLQLLDRLSPLIALFKEKIPLFVCSLFSAAITIYAQHEGGAVMPLEAMPLGFRLSNAVISYVQYINQTIWPHDMAIFYPLPASFPLWQLICSLLVLLLASTAAIRFRRRTPYLFVGWFWFLITLVPVIGLIQAGAQSMADRFTYIPGIGLFIIAAWGVSDLTINLPHRLHILTLLAGVVIMTSATITWRQIGYWRDDESLFRHALQVTSNNGIAHSNLGIALAGKGNLDAAITEYRAALAINPNLLISHNNLGVALEKQGDLDAAIREYREALAINPNYHKARKNLGVALGKKGDLDAAIKEYLEVIAKKPKDFEALNSLGVALQKKGDLDAAIKGYQKAIVINPNYLRARINLGIALGVTGNIDAAINEFREALRIDPNHVEANNYLKFSLDQKSGIDRNLK